MNDLYAELLAFSFRVRPLFRQRYNNHVRDWERRQRHNLFLLYNSDSAFRDAYDAELFRLRNLPMPSWRKEV